ncbi:hypothetical protein BDR04DRAFT_1129079 [Suillus decipiens]|nr:hypothetical protein BDR04DRAFT_1129079 [Suillus decipiens]
MHIAAINTGDLLIPLWRGSFQAEPTDDKSTWAWAVLKKEIWKAHGTLIADTAPYLPGSFNRPPCNPAEQISSGYKAWEWLFYLYGMAPATLYGILPEPYWLNFCHLARGLHIMQQYHISHADLIEAHSHLLDFADEFEEIYYQSHMDHLHFIQPWVHSITHIAPKTVNKGLPICSSQWTMEAIDHTKGSQPLGNGYVLLRCKEQTPHPVCQCRIHIAIAPSVMHWAHLCLTNGQVAHLAWKENEMSRQPRMACNVKLLVDGDTSVAEVLFYFNMLIHGEDRALTLISEYGPPHADLLQSSFQTVFACDTSLKLVEVSVIHSVVAMVPHKFPRIDGTLFYMIECPGLDVLKMGGMNEDLHDKD